MNNRRNHHKLKSNRTELLFTTSKIIEKNSDLESYGYNYNCKRKDEQMLNKFKISVFPFLLRYK